MAATIAECETSQSRWNQAIAVAGGGSVWEDRGLEWSWQAHNGHLMLNFPRAVDPEVGEAGVEWPQFQRRGLGRALLRTVCDAARRVGAKRAVLNATPAGEPLYLADGFVHVGHGVTYWHHLGATC